MLLALVFQHSVPGHVVQQWVEFDAMPTKEDENWCDCDSRCRYTEHVVEMRSVSQHI